MAEEQDDDPRARRKSRGNSLSGRMPEEEKIDNSQPNLNNQVNKALVMSNYIDKVNDNKETSPLGTGKEEVTSDYADEIDNIK